MKPTVQLQFIVGLTRLIAFYFGLRSLDSLAGSVSSYELQRSIAPEIAAKMDGTVVFFFALAGFYLVMVVAVWMTAPFIGRIALQSAGSSAIEPSHEVCWNGVMIFLTGTLILGWGLARLGDSVAQILRAKARNLPTAFDNAEMIRLFTTIVLVGLGGLMMARFPAIHRWMQRRSDSESKPADDSTL